VQASIFLVITFRQEFQKTTCDIYITNHIKNQVEDEGDNDSFFVLAGLSQTISASVRKVAEIFRKNNSAGSKKMGCLEKYMKMEGGAREEDHWLLPAVVQFTPR
jgi:hypothetical protein